MIAGEEKGFTDYDDVPVITVGSKDKLFLVQLPSDVDVASLKGIKVRLDRDEDKVVRTRADKQMRLKKEQATPMDNCFRAMVREKGSNQIVLGPEFSGVISLHEVLPTLTPLSVSEVKTIKMDHPYSKVPQLEGLCMHAVPIGSLSTVEEVNNRNKKRKTSSSSSAEKTPKKEKTAAEPTTEHKTEKKKKEKKEKKDKK